MKLSSVVITVLAVLTAGAAISIFSQNSRKSHSASLLETFARWKVQHGKLYSTPSENTYRLDVFVDQLVMVDESNADYEARMAAQNVKLSGPMFELNAFGDLTDEEFSAMYTGELPSTEEFSPEEVETEAAVENTQDSEPGFNLGASFTPVVRHQGSCGSCWAFAATVELERLAFVQQGKYIDLSQQELVDCVTASSGCQGGHAREAYNYVTKRGGVSKLSDYPYKAAQGSCKSSGKSKVPIKGTTSAYEGLFSTSKAASGTAKGVTGAVSVQTKGPFRYMSKTDDVFDPRGSSDCNTTKSHAIGLIYYRDGVAYVVNSWGTSWGNRGFKKIRPCSSSNLYGAGGKLRYPHNV